MSCTVHYTSGRPLDHDGDGDDCDECGNNNGDHDDYDDDDITKN